MVIAGAGPAGAATAIGLERAGALVQVIEQRGVEATRARSLFLRPQAREILSDLGVHTQGTDTTIASVENQLRGIVKERGIPIEYRQRVVGITEHDDHVSVHVQGGGGSAAVRTLEASMFVDATGGRLAATNVGAMERIPRGPSHVYVTAQYHDPGAFQRISGAFDRQTRELMCVFPTADGTGFITYLDLPPGLPLDEPAALARYDALAGKLNLGTPMSPPQAFDAQQHLARVATQGHVLKIGDSVGNADPYIGAGVAAALLDATTATRLLTADSATLAREGNDVIRAHRHLAMQASAMLAARPVAMRTMHPGDFDGALQRADLQPSWVLELASQLLTSQRVG